MSQELNEQPTNTSPSPSPSASLKKPIVRLTKKVLAQAVHASTTSETILKSSPTEMSNALQVMQHLFNGTKQYLAIVESKAETLERMIRKAGEEKVNLFCEYLREGSAIYEDKAQIINWIFDTKGPDNKGIYRPTDGFTLRQMALACIKTLAEFADYNVHEMRGQFYSWIVLANDQRTVTGKTGKIHPTEVNGKRNSGRYHIGIFGEDIKTQTDTFARKIKETESTKAKREEEGAILESKQQLQHESEPQEQGIIIDNQGHTVSEGQGQGGESQ